MALYDWECAECSTITEVIRPSKDYLIPPDDGCQKCGCKELNKIIIRPEKVKGYLLLGDKHWHSCEYTATRSIRG